MTAGLLIPLLAIVFGLDQERVVVMNTECTQWTFEWEPATGPVVAYDACIEYQQVRDEPIRRDCFPTSINRYTFTPDWWRSWAIEVQAVATDGQRGPWSPHSIIFNINPNISDIDLNGGVGVSDFGILSKEWGKSVE